MTSFLGFMCSLIDSLGGSQFPCPILTLVSNQGPVSFSWTYFQKSEVVWFIKYIIEQLSQQT